MSRLQRPMREPLYLLVMGLPVMGFLMMGLLAVVCTLSVSSPGIAQPTPSGDDSRGEGDSRGERAAGPRASLATQLASDDPAVVRAALDDIRDGRRRQHVAMIATMLRSGQPDALTDRALEALGALQSGAAIDVLSEFTRHRRVGARRRAYQALAAVAGRRAQPLLEQGLRDSDRTVRATAAMALGNLGYRGSIEILFQAFERGVVEAASALGKLADESAVDRFSTHLGSLPLSVLLSGYHEFLRRRDISTETKRAIVVQLGEVSGAMVQRFLREYLTTFPARSRNALKAHVEDTLRRIVANPSRPPAPPVPPGNGE